MKRLLLMLLAFVAVAGMAVNNGGGTASAALGPHAAGGPDQVVQLSTTDAGFGAGQLASSFVLAGKSVISKTPAEWSSMSTEDFASYDAVILNDPTCVFGTDAPIAAAKANAAVWGAAIDGNVIITGTDEQYHFSQSKPYRDKASAFVVADAAKTGAWISLSCYYSSAAPTPLPWLDTAFGAPGDFSVSVSDCLDNVHLVATHPALTGLTDADMSGWGCSLHERFITWSPVFEVLAIDLNGAAVFTAPDGTTGTPYILARGVEVISDIDLFPADATNDLGESHELTAVVTTDDPAPGTPVVGTTVTFNIVGGPHAGVIGSSVTDGTGTATISYTGTIAGTDTIEATFVDALGRTQRSNRVTKTWVAVEICGDGIDNDGDGAIDEGCNEAPDCSTAAASIGEIWPPNHKMVSVSVLGVTDADGDAVTITVDSIWQDEPTDTNGDGNTAIDGAGVGTDTAEVRAERTGDKKVPGNGRVYHIGFTADDGNGGSCSGEVTVGVPHDQGKNTVLVDDGALYDSTVATP